MEWFLVEYLDRTGGEDIAQAESLDDAVEVVRTYWPEPRPPFRVRKWPKSYPTAEQLIRRGGFVPMRRRGR